jgi:ribosomal protein S18 acetylase RimI-like enzyme
MAEERPEPTIRAARAGELEAIVRITGEAFTADSSIDSRIEALIGGRPWQEVKADVVRQEVQSFPDGCFVAEWERRVVGYVTTTVHAAASRGTIANVAVAKEWQGRGLGRRLIERALEYFREQGLKQAKIETLATNATGQHLYTALGFREVARQIHFIMPLEGKGKPASGA